MLPRPVSYASSRQNKTFRKPSLSLNGSDDVWAYRLRLLSNRSRITNLGVLLLVGILFLSLMLNVRHWTWDLGGLDGLGRGVYRSIEDTIERTKEMRELEHLIIVPGHGVWLGDEPSDVYAKNSWALETYQSGEGATSRIEAFVGHIKRGVQLADEDPKSLLVFSGGTTRSIPASEAASYFSLALYLSILTPPPPHIPAIAAATSTYSRTTIEDHALDSYQNLLFSIARFRAVTGRYPEKITVVGYAMKGKRFSELHRKAIRWPSATGNWRYVGIDIADSGHKLEAEKGEIANGYTPYSNDLYGCHGSLLAKRRARNVHHRVHPYHISAPEMAGLIEWCPDDATDVYDGSLPWDD